MAKEDDVVAAALAKLDREGYPKLTEDHPFFGKLRAFMNEKAYGIPRRNAKQSFAYRFAESRPLFIFDKVQLRL